MQAPLRVKIRKLDVSNFKSFPELHLELDNLTTLVGANAAGKSSVVSALAFLRDIAEYKLQNAISIHGGIDYVRNLAIGQDQDLEFAIELQTTRKLPILLFPEEDQNAAPKPKSYNIIIDDLKYSFALHFARRGPLYKVVRDELRIKGRIVESPARESGRRRRVDPDPELVTRGIANLRYFVERGRLRHDIQIPGFRVPEQALDIFSAFGAKSPRQGVRVRGLLLEQEFIFAPIVFPGLQLQNLFSGVAVFDFDPKRSKQSSHIEGLASLDEDGSNLAIVLREIRRSPKQYSRLMNHVRDILPFVGSIQVSKMLDKSFLLTLKETFNVEYSMPASLLSDGTLQVIALIVALYFDDNWLTILEEPERNLHPALFSRVVDLIKERSQEKQLIITTHNPEVIKHVGLESLRLVRRSQDGYSSISKPSTAPEVQEFVREDLGLDVLFVQGLLGD